MTNERLVQYRAPERLFDAELAEVLGVSVGAAGRGHAERPVWNGRAAALLLLGVLVAGGVAWLRVHDGANEAQQPRAFDPVYPWYERESPWDLRGYEYVGHVADLPAVPATTVDLAVDARRQDLLTAMFSRPALRRLLLLRLDRELDRTNWQALGRMPELEALTLQRPSRIAAADLRELRVAPKLRALTLSFEGAFDAELGAAVVELPSLRTLSLSDGKLLPGGIAALAGLPHLSSLILDQITIDDEMAKALTGLRGLRQLHISGVPGQAAATVVSPGQMAQIAKLSRLEVLMLPNQEMSDAVLAELPAHLLSLTLPSMPSVTVEGYRSLRRLNRLRSLNFALPEAAEAQAALVETLAELPLEHCSLSLSGARPDAAFWEALLRLPNLRRFGVGSENNLGPVVARCARLRNLVRLTLHCPELPEPEVLQPLVGHPQLRRLELSLFHGSISTASEPLAALRTMLGSQVEVVVQ